MAEGVWRTISGRRVFIKEGQSLSEAMRESGKFKDGDKDNSKSDKKERLNEEYTYDYEKIDNKYIVSFYDNEGNLVYKNTAYTEDQIENLTEIFVGSPEYYKWRYENDLKELAKKEKDNMFGNARNTKFGREGLKKAEEIKENTGDVIKDFKVEKSNISESKYLNLKIDTDKYPQFNDEYVIRVSDHKRPLYSSSDSLLTYEHRYDFEVILDKVNKINWDWVVREVSNDINMIKKIK